MSGSWSALRANPSGGQPGVQGGLACHRPERRGLRRGLNRGRRRQLIDHAALPKPSRRVSPTTVPAASSPSCSTHKDLAIPPRSPRAERTSPTAARDATAAAPARCPLLASARQRTRGTPRFPPPAAVGRRPSAKRRAHLAFRPSFLADLDVPTPSADLPSAASTRGIRGGAILPESGSSEKHEVESVVDRCGIEKLSRLSNVPFDEEQLPIRWGVKPRRPGRTPAAHRGPAASPTSGRERLVEFGRRRRRTSAEPTSPTRGTVSKLRRRRRGRGGRGDLGHVHPFLRIRESIRHRFEMGLAGQPINLATAVRPTREPRATRRARSVGESSSAGANLSPWNMRGPSGRGGRAGRSNASSGASFQPPTKSRCCCNPL